jgi:ATP-dependent Clp protease protease subunit
MAVIVNGTEIVLTGAVGQMWFDEDHFTHSDVITALARIGRDQDITVRVNSGGGIATEGAAIHSAFAAHKGKVEMIVEGWAASAASLLIMAGDTVTMRPGAILMIHDPAGVSFGTADDHRKHADALDVIGNVYAQVYADKTGKTPEEMRAVMREEVWLSPEEAVAQGFADAVDGDQDNEIEPTAFGGVSAYARTPERIVALAKARGWSRVTMAAQPAALTTPKGKDAAMSDSTEPAGTEEPKPATVTPEAPADAGAIAEACATANMPATLAASLIKANATMSAVNERITEAKAITEAATLAGMPGMGAKLIAAGVSLATARDLIAEARASKDEAMQTDTAHTNRNPGATTAQEGWAKAVAALPKQK